MSIVRAARENLLSFALLKLASGLGALIVTYVIQEVYAYLLGGIWLIIEVASSVKSLRLWHFLGSISESEPEHVSMTVSRLGSAPIVYLQSAFSPLGGLGDSYEIHGAYPEVFKRLIESKQEVLGDVYRGTDPRTPAVLAFNHETVVLVPSTRAHDEAHYRYFRGFFYINHPERAISELSKAIDQYSDHVEARILRANLLIQQQRYDAAIKDLTEAIQHFTLNKEYPDAYAMRGSAYYSKERFKEAMDDFTEYLKRHPENYASRIQRGFCYYQLGDWNSAISDLHSVLDSDPSEFRARSALANIYTEKGEPTKALNLVDDAACEAASSRPNELRLLFVARGLAQAAMHRREAAITSFSRAIELDPEDDFALRCRAIQYSQGPDGPKLAEQDLERASKISQKRDSSMSFAVPGDAPVFVPAEIPRAEPEEKGTETVDAPIIVDDDACESIWHVFYNKLCSSLFFVNDTIASLNDFTFWSTFSLRKSAVCLVCALPIAFLELLPSRGFQIVPSAIVLGGFMACFAISVALTIGILKLLKSDGSSSDALMVYCFCMSIAIVCAAWIPGLGLVIAWIFGLHLSYPAIRFLHHISNREVFIAMGAPLLAVPAVVIAALLLIK